MYFPFFPPLLFYREVLEKDAKDYADSIQAVFVETSAKNAININEVFTEISKDLVKQSVTFSVLRSMGHKLAQILTNVTGYSFILNLVHNLPYVLLQAV